MKGSTLRTVSSWKKLALWPHQRKAVEMIHKYLESDSLGSALIRMPMGTGKTGVMAIAAQCLVDSSDALIIAPWAQLTRQISREIETEFWRKIGHRPKQATKSAKTFLPSIVTSVLKQRGGKPTVLVCTNQTLERLFVNDNRAYRSLRDCTSLVLVDEGHREPAPAWARSVRGLEKPTVLFTATPYRNDHRLFDVDPNHVFRLSHKEAVEQRFIREVNFVEADFKEDARTFVKALLDYYHGDFQKQKPSAASADRVIVRCETDSDITRVAAELKRAGEAVVAVHDRFSNNEDMERFNKVPDPAKTGATFWVHQFKLIEGIDDPNFSLLALYQPLGNARALVQQVGRIIRNPSRAKGQIAYVFCHRRHKQRLMWDSYLRYEDRLGGGAIKDVGPAEIFEDLLQLQDQYQYLDGNFRGRFDPKAPDFHLHLNYTLAANIYMPQRGFKMGDLLADVRRTVDEEDFILGNEVAPDNYTHVFIYGRCGTSPLLIDQTFMELNLGFSIVRRAGDYIFYYDSEGLTPEYLADRASRVEPRKLEGLLSGERVRISQISLLNSDLALYSVRRRSLSAYSIGQIAPGLADYAHFCSTAAGIVESPKAAARRYVGFTRARVSERSSIVVEYDDYVKWTRSIAATLKKKRNGSVELFNRYALNIAFPKDPKPEHILFDIEDVEEDYLPRDPSSDGTLQKLLFDDRCWDVNDDGNFLCTTNGTEVTATVRFEPEKRRFEIVSSELESMYPHNGIRDGRRRNLVAHLNFTQSFRIITDTGLIYAHGQFYESRMPLFGRRVAERIDLRQILFARDELGHIKTEKGDKVLSGGAGWQRGSVFGYIDRIEKGGLFASEKFKPDILICDDLGSELADFIAAQFDPPRVCMIHAKVGKAGSSLSASAFHDVCGQAMKNLGLLNPQWNQRPKNLEIWNGPWVIDEIGAVKRRIRQPARGMKAEAAWEKLERLIRHPAAVREVWVVMGDGMSRAAFEREQRKERPPASAIQLIYLLQSTWSAVSSVGAIFKVFCKP